MESQGPCTRLPRNLPKFVKLADRERRGLIFPQPSYVRLEPGGLGKKHACSEKCRSTQPNRLMHRTLSLPASARRRPRRYEGSPSATSQAEALTDHRQEGQREQAPIGIPAQLAAQPGGADVLEIPGNDHTLHIRSPFVYLGYAHIAVNSLHREVLEIAIAT